MIRIVKMHFTEENVANFLTFFDTIKEKVNHFPGCNGVKLLQDIHKPGIIMTYSHWENEDALDNYRHSETFGQIWPNVKPWFEQKAEAWSVEERFDGFFYK